jgi:hypothetical protein
MAWLRPRVTNLKHPSTGPFLKVLPLSPSLLGRFRGLVKAQTSGPAQIPSSIDPNHNIQSNYLQPTHLPQTVESPPKASFSLYPLDLQRVLTYTLLTHQFLVFIHYGNEKGRGIGKKPN